MLKRISHFFKTYFITGLLVTLPLGLTYWILKVLLQSMERLIGNPIQRYFEIYIPGMGIILLVCLILLIGIFARNLIGRKLGNLGENLLQKIPLVRPVYGFVKHLVNTIFMQGQQNFKGVVLVEYPRRGIYSIGFVTSEVRGAVKEELEAEMVNVFLPTTPNPTSGFYLIFPKEDVTFLNLTIEEGAKIIISAGMVSPEPTAPLRTDVKEENKRGVV